MSPVRSRKCLRQQSLTNVRICSLQILLRQSEKRLCLRGSIRDTVDSRQRRKIIKAGCNLLAQPVVVSPTSDQRGASDRWNCWDAGWKIQSNVNTWKSLIWRVAGATEILVITKFYGQLTCTLNMKEHLPDDYNNITHNTIAAMLFNEELLSEIDTIQIWSCHRYTSICFTRREILEPFCKSEHQLLPDKQVHVEPDYYNRQRISIRNIPIELPHREVKTFLSEYVTITGKTYYLATGYNNKHFTNGIRMYQSIKMQKHLSWHIYQFGRNLRICYDLQTKTNLAPPGANLPYTEETPVPENHPAPIIHTKHTQKETPTLPKTQNIKSKKRKQPINRQPESATPITHQPTQHQPITPTDIQQRTKPANTPTIRNNEDEIFPQNNHPNDHLTANPHNTTNNNTTSNSFTFWETKPFTRHTTIPTLLERLC